MTIYDYMISHRDKFKQGLQIIYNVSDLKIRDYVNKPRKERRQIKKAIKFYNFCKNTKWIFKDK